MRAMTLAPLILSTAVGEAFQTPAWANDLAPRFESGSNMFTGLVARDPRGGGRGGGSSSSGDDDDDDDNGSSISGTNNECASDEKLCGDYCIPSNGVCCSDDSLSSYCQADERCVPLTPSSSSFKCCPDSDSSCDSDSDESTYSDIGTYPGVTCDASRPLLNEGWVLGAAGIFIALGA